MKLYSFGGKNIKLANVSEKWVSESMRRNKAGKQQLSRNKLVYIANGTYGFC